MRNLKRVLKLLTTGALICAALLCVGQVPTARAESFRVDAAHSSTLFRVKHLNATNFWGRFNGIAGKIVLDEASPTVEITIKAESVDTANSARDDHLKGPDFFNAKQFPEISFKSTAVKKANDTTYDVEGMLTLHGVSKPVNLQLVRTGAGKNQRGAAVAGFETTFDIKRSDYNMKYGLEGVGDDIRLVVSMETAKQ